MRVHPYQATATSPNGCTHTPAQTRGVPLEVRIHQLARLSRFLLSRPLCAARGVEGEYEDKTLFGRLIYFFNRLLPEIKSNIIHRH